MHKTIFSDESSTTFQIVVLIIIILFLLLINFYKFEKKSSMVFSLEKIKAQPLFLILVFIISIFIPGYLFIFIFKPELFFKLDLFRLSVISLSISTPCFLMNSMIAVILPKDKIIDSGHDEKNDSIVIEAIYIGCILSSSLLYAVDLFGYLLNYPIKLAIISILACEIFLCIIFYFVNTRKK